MDNNHKPFSKEDFINETKLGLGIQLDGVNRGDKYTNYEKNQELLFKKLEEQIQLNATAMEQFNEKKNEAEQLAEKYRQLEEQKKDVEDQLRFTKTFIDKMEKRPPQPLETEVEKKVRIETDREKKAREIEEAVSSMVSGLKKRREA